MTYEESGRIDCKMKGFNLLPIRYICISLVQVSGCDYKSDEQEFKD